MQQLVAMTVAEEFFGFFIFVHQNDEYMFNEGAIYVFLKNFSKMANFIPNTHICCIRLP